MEEKKKTCCFFGHRKIAEADRVKERLHKIIEDLIVYNNVEKFLFGSKSQFDGLCREVVTELKEKYPHIKRIYVRAEYPEIGDDYKAYLLENCEDTYFPQRAVGSQKAVYIERNYEMIDNSDFCVVYYNESYSPPKRKNSRRDLMEYQPKSGTKTAYEYAKRKKKVIIQAAEF